MRDTTGTFCFGKHASNSSWPFNTEFSNVYSRGKLPNFKAKARLEFSGNFKQI